MSDDNNRTIHAENDEFEVVRYKNKRNTQWFIEPKAKENPRQAVSVSRAAQFSRYVECDGGTVHRGRPGGSTFDRLVGFRAEL